MSEMTVVIRAATLEEVDDVARMYEWLFAPPGTRPPRWEPTRAAAALGRVVSSSAATVLIAEHERELGGASHLELDSAEARVAAHRFYERELPSWRSVCFGWEL
jgi:hypothetical protein